MDQGFVRQPFSVSFLVLSAVGFLVVGYYTLINVCLDLTWGLLFMLVFAIFGLASLKTLKKCSDKCVCKECMPVKKGAKKAVPKAVAKKVVKKIKGKKK